MILRDTHLIPLLYIDRLDPPAGVASSVADRPLGIELEMDVWGHVSVHDPGARDVVLYERDGSLSDDPARAAGGYPQVAFLWVGGDRSP